MDERAEAYSEFKTLNRADDKMVPDRLAYARRELERNRIDYTLEDKESGHIKCSRSSDGKIFDYYADTGKIEGYEERGIHSLITFLEQR